MLKAARGGIANKTEYYVKTPVYIVKTIYILFFISIDTPKWGIYNGIVNRNNAEFHHDKGKPSERMGRKARSLKGSSLMIVRPPLDAAGFYL